MSGGLGAVAAAAAVTVLRAAGGVAAAGSDHQSYRVAYLLSRY